MTDDMWAEGSLGRRPLYSERLVPAWWAWILVPALVSVVAIAYGSAYDASVGWLILVAGTVIGYAAVVSLSPTVRVDERVFQAGRARLPLEFAGTATALAPEELRTRLRTGDARTYLLIRVWASRSGVLVENVDPADPHPAWLVSTRRPDAVVEALARARSEADPGSPAE